MASSHNIRVPTAPTPKVSGGNYVWMGEEAGYFSLYVHPRKHSEKVLALVLYSFCTTSCHEDILLCLENDSIQTLGDNIVTTWH